MKAIVIYYSYSGNTKNIALHIAEALNAGTAVIDTVKAYEGDYDAVVKQGKDEINKGFCCLPRKTQKVGNDGISRN